MTFGQHLQELRVCLMRAVLGLLVTVGIGLVIGPYVVDWIQVPLSRALEEYVQKQAKIQTDQQIEQLREKGKALPLDTKRVDALISEDRLIPQETFIDPHELIEQLKQFYPEQTKNWEQAAQSIKPMEGREGMLRVFLWHPLENDKSTHVKSLSAQEPFSIYVKASMLVGVILASPWIFLQIWNFVAAGLYPHERWYVNVFLPFSVCLFLAGAALAFGFVFQPVLRFLFAFNSMMGIDPDPRISEWLSFVLLLPLGFGVAFQLPLVMLFLERIGIFSIKAYKSSWKIAALGIFVLAMLLTPEPTSMMIMSVPLLGLYFGGILLCKLMPRRSKAYKFD